MYVFSDHKVLKEISGSLLQMIKNDRSGFDSAHSSKIIRLLRGSGSN